LISIRADEAVISELREYFEVDDRDSDPCSADVKPTLKSTSSPCIYPTSEAAQRFTASEHFSKALRFPCSTLRLRKEVILTSCAGPTFHNGNQRQIRAQDTGSAQPTKGRPYHPRVFVEVQWQVSITLS
jgi:hypothetical protein